MRQNTRSNSQSWVRRRTHQIEAQDEPDEPGGETAVPGDVHSVQEHSTGDTNEHIDEPHLPCQDTAPRGEWGEWGELGPVEGVR